MSILVGEETKLLVQGITGKQGQVHTRKIVNYGTTVLAGVSPNKANQNFDGIPIFETAQEAKNAFPEINTSMIIVPPKFVLGSALEAIDANIPLIVIITEFIPVHDAIKLNYAAKQKGIRVIGGNTIGIISPGKGKVGVMPDFVYQPGHIGVISRSGTLTHETSSNLTFAGFGQSSCVGIGGDMIGGLTHTDVLKMFRDDPDTDAIILIGEIGGSGEEDAAEYIKNTVYPKPVFAYIAGIAAPAGKKMGHAGAIVSGKSGTAASKVDALRSAGVSVAETPGRLIDLIRQLNEKMKGKLMTLTPLSDEGVDI